MTTLTVSNSGKFFAGALGEIKQFAISLTGAVTKAVLQANGWAICDGTDIVSAQGISDAVITGNAPDLQHKFVRMSNDETSGNTGGSDTVNIPNSGWSSGGATPNGTLVTGVSSGGTGATSTRSISFTPTYYETATFLKVV